MTETNYKRWIPRFEPPAGELAAMGLQVSGFEYVPRFSLALVASDADEVWLKSSIDSTLKGVYPNLELCVVDDASERPHVREVLAEYAAVEGRVRVERVAERGSRARTYNAALSMSTGEFVALLGAGDELAPEALFKAAEFLQNVRADVLYTDEDSIDVAGERLDPSFKPYWSPDLSLSAAYTGRLCVMRKGLIDALGGFREGYEGAEEHDLILRLSEKTRRIYHLPGVLYHRRTLPVETGAELARNEASPRVVEEAIARNGGDATVKQDPATGPLRVLRRVGGHPEVSVIVSAPEGAGGSPILGELKNNAYPVHQVIVAGGEGQRTYPGTERVNHPFPARALNLAAAEASGKFLLFVDGGARTEDPGWISELLGHAQRRGVGAVGCRLRNPDGTLRNGGSLVDAGRLVGGLDDSGIEDVESTLLVKGPFNPVAVTTGCMMLRKAAFDRVGGFDDEKLPTAFYDLDLSFRLREGGLFNVYTPYATLVRGSGTESPAGEEEIAYMWRRWWEELVRLFYYQRSPLYSEYAGTYEQAPGLFAS